MAEPQKNTGMKRVSGLAMAHATLLRLGVGLLGARITWDQIAARLAGGATAICGAAAALAIAAVLPVPATANPP